MLNYNIYIGIVIVIALNFIKYNFETKILSLFKIVYKIIDKILQIFYFIKVKNLS